WPGANDRTFGKEDLDAVEHLKHVKCWEQNCKILIAACRRSGASFEYGDSFVHNTLKRGGRVLAILLNRRADQLAIENSLCRQFHLILITRVLPNALKVSCGPVHAQAHQPCYTNLVQLLLSSLTRPTASPLR